MKYTEGDQITKQKMEALGTLDGGIVFGREEAWEKLQRRLDKKPAKKIVLKWWLAAAAVLLIIIFCAGLLYIPSKQINGISQTTGQTIKMAEESKIDSQSLPVNTTPLNLVNEKAQAARPEKVYSKPDTRKQKKIESVALKPVQQQSVAVPVNTMPEIAIKNNSNSGPATEFKVVHINELAYGGNVGYSITQPGQPQTVVINKMKVVSFNDLEDNRSKRMMEEEEMKCQEKNVAKKLNNVITSEGYSTLNPLHKIKIITQK